jgi:hypothetical protein
MADMQATPVDPKTDPDPNPGVFPGGPSGAADSPAAGSTGSGPISTEPPGEINSAEILLQSALNRIQALEERLAEIARDDTQAIVSALSARLVQAEHALASLGVATVVGTHDAVASDGRVFVSWLQKFGAYLTSFGVPKG